MSRILIVGPRLEIGGTERHLEQILPPLQTRGMDMHLHVMERGGPLEERISLAGVPIEGAKAGLSRVRRSWEIIRKLAVRIKRLKPDLVHMFLPEPVLLGSLAAEISQHPRRIISRRSLAHYRKGYVGLKALEMFFNKRTSILLGNSMAVVQELRAECGRSSDIGLIPNGVSIPPVCDESMRVSRRAAIGIPSDTLAIVSIANLLPYKGHADMIKALGLVKHNLPHQWKLVLIGRDEGYSVRLNELIKTAHLVNHVMYLGVRQDAEDIAAACDIAVLPSHQEGSSNALLEMLACGLPTVATAVGGNLEAIEDGENGLLVPVAKPDLLAQAIVQLVNNPEYAICLGQAARRTVASRFSTEDMVNRYERLYCSHEQVGVVPIQKIIDG
ncbi:MAG: glycosyl transferase family 1 [marine bacterium B5-7]|nr:MAG: glycosyl transferase family 1 [marine bacterium B5-7]